VKDGYETDYATGPAVKFEASAFHYAENGQRFPIWGKLTTPQGAFYIAPEFPEQQAKTALGPYFYEGVLYLYKVSQG
jgi:hypothetical protein